MSAIAVPAEDFTAWLFSFRFPPTKITVPLPEPWTKNIYIDHLNICPHARLTAKDGEDDVDVGEEEEEQALVTEEHW